MLKITNLHSYYGPIEAIKGLDMEVQDGQIVCLIGSNGAGKTTLLKSISGFIQRTGSILWNDEELINKKARVIAQKGIMQVPEGRHVFPGLSVRDNLEIGTSAYRKPFRKADFDDDLENVYTLFPRLKERRDQLSWSLSGGEQQMLAIGRALMGRPKILLLDEPSMGLAPLVVANLFEKIVEINRQGMTVLLIEQNAQLALKISNYAYVIEQGQIRLEGNPKELLKDSRLVEAYLGKFSAGNRERAPECPPDSESEA
ncbi:MAG: ABC transporter ATP-binding protein [Christensenellales bacterium]|jgi:branched-chain amino acid transport system ATP-binding protein